jgi:hypothetical protein
MIGELMKWQWMRWSASLSEDDKIYLNYMTWLTKCWRIGNRTRDTVGTVAAKEKEKSCWGN